jgi:hypothetical protein
MATRILLAVQPGRDIDDPAAGRAAAALVRGASARVRLVHIAPCRGRGWTGTTAWSPTPTARWPA